MRRLRLFFLFFALPVAAWATDYLELTDFKLIDGTGAPARDVKRLIAKNGVIVALDEADPVPQPEADARWLRIGLKEAWVIPGLIDTHVHVARTPHARNAAERILRDAIRGGVTAVRDLGGDARALVDIQRAMQVGEFIGPDVVISAMLGGPALYRSGPASQLSPGYGPGEAPWTRALTADSNVPRVLAEAKGAGASNLKLYGNISPALATMIIEQAAAEDLLTTAHATVFSAKPGDLVAAGIGSLSHAPYLVWEAAETVPFDYGMRTQGAWRDIPPDHPALLDLYRRMAGRGVFLDATLFVFKAMREFSPQVQAEWTDVAFPWAAQATRLAHRAGVRVTTGTDWFEPRAEGGLPNTHAELALLVESAGFTPMEAIVAATRNGADALGFGDRLGTLEIGKAADLVVLEADPLADIRHTERIRMTIKRGVVVPAE